MTNSGRKRTWPFEFGGQCGPAGCLCVQVAGTFSEECGTPEVVPGDLEAAVTTSPSPHCLQPDVLEALRGMALCYRDFLGLFVF